MSDYLCTISLGNTNKSVSLEEWNKTLSLVSTWEGKDGKVRANWCFRQERVNGENVPGVAETVKVKLGDKATTVSLLLQLLAALGHPVAGKPSDGEDIPF